MGGIPTNYLGEVLTLKDGNPDHVVPGLMAIGEAACVSVHGANRLGSNSLIDLVVFGRAAARRCAETIEPGTHAGAAEGRRRVLRSPASTASATPRAARRRAELRLKMQKAMQTHCAVFRDGPVLEEGVRQIGEVWKGSDDIAVTDRSLIWNSDLDRDAGVRQPHRAGRGDGRSGRAQPRGEPRRARARGLPQPRRRQLDEAHARRGPTTRQSARQDSTTGPCTPTRMTNEVKYIEPKKREY